MIVRYQLDGAAPIPRVVDVRILDGLASPEAIAAESMAALIAMRNGGQVSPWRTAGIVSADGEAWHGAAGAHQRMAKVVAERKTPIP